MVHFPFRFESVILWTFCGSQDLLSHIYYLLRINSCQCTSQSIQTTKRFSRCLFENHLNIKNCPMMTYNIYIPSWNTVLMDGNPFQWLAPKATLMRLYNNLSIHFLSELARITQGTLRRFRLIVLDNIKKLKARVTGICFCFNRY